jgi:hypothetical protein
MILETSTGMARPALLDQQHCPKDGSAAQAKTASYSDGQAGQKQAFCGIVHLLRVSQSRIAAHCNRLRDGRQYQGLTGYSLVANPAQPDSKIDDSA